MLKLEIEPQEYYDEEKNLFKTTKGGTYHFEHSLKSIARWESKWKKPFLQSDEKTTDEWVSYFKCMCFEEISDDLLTQDVLTKLAKYMGESQTATHVKKDGNHNGAVVTSEVLYMELAELGIPFEVDRWNLSRLVAIISVGAARRQPKKKMSRREIARQNHDLNEQRLKKLKSKG